MLKKNQSIQTDEIDFAKIVLTLWKEKIIILSFSLVFFFSSYIYLSLQPKEFKTTATIKNVEKGALFLLYDKTVNINKDTTTISQVETFDKILYDFFNDALLSPDNMALFVNQNNKINSFKNFLEQNQISVTKYFFSNTSLKRFGQEKQKNKILENNFYLNFPKELDGRSFLNEYIIFSFEKSIQNTIQSIISRIKVDLRLIKKNLEIAKMLNLQNPIIQQGMQSQIEKQGNGNVYLTTEPKNMYYSGSKVLELEKAKFEELLLEAELLKINFNPFLQKATQITTVSHPPFKFGIFGFIAGLFLSLIFITIKNILKNTK